jgi:hypothetical protein
MRRLIKYILPVIFMLVMPILATNSTDDENWLTGSSLSSTDEEKDTSQRVVSDLDKQPVKTCVQQPDIVLPPPPAALPVKSVNDHSTDDRDSCLQHPDDVLVALSLPLPPPSIADDSTPLLQPDGILPLPIVPCAELPTLPPLDQLPPFPLDDTSSNKVAPQCGRAQDDRQKEVLLPETLPQERVSPPRVSDVVSQSGPGRKEGKPEIFAGKSPLAYTCFAAGTIAAAAAIADLIHWAVSTEVKADLAVIKKMNALAHNDQLDEAMFNKLASQLTVVSPDRIEAIRQALAHDKDAVKAHCAALLAELQKQHDAQGIASRLKRGFNVRKAQLRALGQSIMQRIKKKAPNGC